MDSVTASSSSPRTRPPPSSGPLLLALPPTPRRSSSKRTASSSPPHPHSWADSWATGFSKQPSLPLEKSRGRVQQRLPLIDTAAAAASQSRGSLADMAWRSPTPIVVDDDSDALSDCTKAEERWIESVDDGFLLDDPLSHDIDDSTSSSLLLRRPRFNSLGLSLAGDLPSPSFSPPDLAYPSPCTPSTSTCGGGGAYFPLPTLASASRSGSPSLPPSPALIPISLSSPSAQEPAFSPAAAAPRAQPSTTHPLHRAKRLSMTPLSQSSSLPLYSPPPLARLQLRKGSIVDLPPVSALLGGEGMPLTPPLTPLGEAEDLPQLKEEDVPELPPAHATGLGEERSKRFTKAEGVVKRQRQRL